MKKRVTTTDRLVSAGCLDCGKPGAMWTGGNAQAVAARHHDRSGHRTWVNVYMKIRYGAVPVDDRQHELEAAIDAAVSPGPREVPLRGAGRSGGEPDATPLTDFDAPSADTAGVSAPQGRPVETRGQMPRGARGRKPELQP